MERGTDFNLGAAVRIVAIITVVMVIAGRFARCSGDHSPVPPPPAPTGLDSSARLDSVVHPESHARALTAPGRDTAGHMRRSLQEHEIVDIPDSFQTLAVLDDAAHHYLTPDHAAHFFLFAPASKRPCKEATMARNEMQLGTPATRREGRYVVRSFTYAVRGSQSRREFQVYDDSTAGTRHVYGFFYNSPAIRRKYGGIWERFVGSYLPPAH